MPPLSQLVGLIEIDDDALDPLDVGDPRPVSGTSELSPETIGHTLLRLRQTVASSEPPFTVTPAENTFQSHDERCGSSCGDADSRIPADLHELHAELEEHLASLLDHWALPR